MTDSKPEQPLPLSSNKHLKGGVYVIEGAGKVSKGTTLQSLENIVKDGGATVNYWPNDGTVFISVDDKSKNKKP